MEIIEMIEKIFLYFFWVPKKLNDNFKELKDEFYSCGLRFFPYYLADYFKGKGRLGLLSYILFSEDDWRDIAERMAIAVDFEEKHEEMVARREKIKRDRTFSIPELIVNKKNYKKVFEELQLDFCIRCVPSWPRKAEPMIDLFNRQADIICNKEAKDEDIWNAIVELIQKLEKLGLVRIKNNRVSQTFAVHFITKVITKDL